MVLDKRIATAIGGGVLAITSLIVQHFEGTKLESYRDAVGVWTVCTGHTETAGPGQTKTQEECDELLRSDLGVALDAVDDQVEVPIANTTRAALVSFTFNVGAGALAGSTLLEKLNAGKIRAACNELPRWVYGEVKGKYVRMRGLERRRATERDVCLMGVENDADTNGAVGDRDRGDRDDGYSWFDMATG